MALTEMVLETDRQRHAFGVHTTQAFSVTEPWPIAIDLPALSARRAAIRKRAATP